MKANLTLQQRKSIQKRVSELVTDSIHIKAESIRILWNILRNSNEHQWIINDGKFHKVMIDTENMALAVTNAIEYVKVETLDVSDVLNILIKISHDLIDEAKNVNEYLDVSETICVGIDEDPLNFAELLKEWGEEHNFTSKQLENLAKGNPSFIIDQLIIKKDGKKNK